MSVPKVMKAQSIQARALDNRSPWPVEISPRLIVPRSSCLPGNHIGADTRQVSENVEGRGIQHDRLLARLAVGQEEQSAFKVYLRPFQVQDFPQAGAGKN